MKAKQKVDLVERTISYKTTNFGDEVKKMENKKSKVKIAITMTEPIYEKVKAYADVNGLNVSSTINMVITQWLYAGETLDTLNKIISKVNQEEFDKQQLMFVESVDKKDGTIKKSKKKA